MYNTYYIILCINMYSVLVPPATNEPAKSNKCELAEPGALRAPPASATWPGTQGTTLGRPPRQGPAGCPLRRRDHRRCCHPDAIGMLVYAWHTRGTPKRASRGASTAQSTARRARQPPPSSRTTCASSRSPLCPVIGARRSPSPTRHLGEIQEISPVLSGAPLAGLL